jgi:cytochrome c-type biogenesis protein CcmH/NrfF
VNRRRAGTVILAALLAVLAAGALAGLWRSARPARPADPARALAAGLRCPACEGESVADSRSPIAAAMREVIGAQLAQGRSAEEVRAYIVDRYGPEVLAAPPARGPGLLLWSAPGLLLLAGVWMAVARRRRHSVDVGRSTRVFHDQVRVDRPTYKGRRAGAHRRSPETVWNAAAGCLLVLVAGVAAAAPRLAPDPPSTPAPATAPSTMTTTTPADPLALARTMEQQGRYDAAAEVYRAALRTLPTDEVRLRLAFALLRTGTADGAGEAAQLANQVLAGQPDAADAVLILGLAQRQSGSAAAAATLRRFLALAPAHPAAAEIRRLLEPPVSVAPTRSLGFRSKV